jgi:hypothetical protein
MKKKAQSKMFETIGVILVFFVLLAIGFIFFGSLLTGSAKQKIIEDREIRAVKIAKTAVTLPELSCSRTQTIENCFDKDKIAAFSEVSSTRKNLYYFDILKNSVITAEQIYPSSTEKIVIYRNPKGTSLQSIWMPIAIYNPDTDTSTFGLLKVDVYE